MSVEQEGMITPLKLLAVPLLVQQGAPLACFPGGAARGLMLSSLSAWPFRPFQLSCLQPGRLQPVLSQGLCLSWVQGWAFLLIHFHQAPALPAQSSSPCKSGWLASPVLKSSRLFPIWCHLQTWCLQPLFWSLDHALWDSIYHLNKHSLSQGLCDQGCGRGVAPVFQVLLIFLGFPYDYISSGDTAWLIWGSSALNIWRFLVTRQEVITLNEKIYSE